MMGKNQSVGKATLNGLAGRLLHTPGVDQYQSIVSHDSGGLVEQRRYYTACTRLL